ncbi:unnamed protein product [Adineta steineri]|uniref:Structure-specific endonuclease subunit SLX1 homolog n=1 Tax=Adineta steineri TaxID=433720 RepID=A0A818GGE7_9BILA|nr:unnamed protein product [Adineta steineri]CAF3489008.1 unnamed protein product [Adineta steineri]
MSADETTIVSIDNSLQTSFNQIADTEVENFFGCYLLNSLNPKCKGRTYIGFTVNLNRRIKQHNKGKDFGGAKRTSGKGPWEMVLIVHGFPNEISALRFEWAWQNPEQSVRLKHLNLPKTKRFSLKFKLQILAEMLSIGPWTRLPLTIRWLTDKKQTLEKLPPFHMPITSGPINVSKNTNTIPSKRKKVNNQILSTENDDTKSLASCSLCNDNIQPIMYVSCPKCSTPFHIICLSKYFLNNTQQHYIIPIDGSCPSCKKNLLWGEIIQNKYTNRSLSLATANSHNESDDEDTIF